MTQCVDSGTNSTSSYVYGAYGLRRQATVTANGTATTTNTIYDATMPVQETTYNSATGQNVLSATYFQGAQGPVYRRDGYNNVSWYVYDGLGSVVAELSPNGTVTASRKYDVYGAIRSGQAGTSSQKFVGKLGHESDASTGLIYMRARYYEPGTGRFISQDPKLQGSNWFAYCDGNPINLSDNTGTSSRNINISESANGFALLAMTLLMAFVVAYSNQVNGDTSTLAVTILLIMEIGAVYLISDALQDALPGHIGSIATVISTVMGVKVNAIR